MLMTPYRLKQQDSTYILSFLVLNSIIQNISFSFQAEVVCDWKSTISKSLLRSIAICHLKYITIKTHYFKGCLCDWWSKTCHHDGLIGIVNNIKLVFHCRITFYVLLLSVNVQSWSSICVSSLFKINSRMRQSSFRFEKKF